MKDITVSKINESIALVECVEESTARELYDYFTFWSPGYKYSPAYKAKHWDGRIHLLHKSKGTLPAGLTLYVEQFAKGNKYSVDIDPNLLTMNSFSLEEAKEFSKTLKLTTKGKPLKPRDYQILGFAKAIRYKRVVLISPTASGKSLIMYMISQYLLTHKKCVKGLIIVPTINLVEQLASDFVDYGGKESSIQKIYQGQSQQIIKPITISTWQSIYDTGETKFFEQFDFVIGDEAHSFKATSLRDIMANLVNATYRIGTTGTLDDYKIHKLYIEGYFGPTSHITTTKKLIEEGHVSDVAIKAIILGHPEHARTLLRTVPDYQIEMDFIVLCKARNTFLKNLALSLNGNTLLLFQYVEKHGEVLYEAIRNKAGARKVFFVYGGTEGEQRESVRRITELETDAIIVASYGVFSTGVNIRNLHNLILASPSKSKIRILQSIGRILRLAEGKSIATVYDISDDFRQGKYTNHTLKHYLERMKLYEAQGFKVSKYIVGLDYAPSN